MVEQIEGLLDAQVRAGGHLAARVRLYATALPFRMQYGLMQKHTVLQTCMR